MSLIYQISEGKVIMHKYIFLIIFLFVGYSNTACTGEPTSDTKNIPVNPNPKTSTNNPRRFNEFLKEAQKLYDMPSDPNRELVITEEERRALAERLPEELREQFINPPPSDPNRELVITEEERRALAERLPEELREQFLNPPDPNR